MKIIPVGPSLVVMVGPSGAGKSSFFERNRVEPREVVASDELRFEFTGNMERQDKNAEVFREFHRRIEAKISAGQRVWADATNIRDADRRRVAEVGQMLNVPITYLVINRPVEHKIRTGGWRNKVFNKDGIGLIEQHEQVFVANEGKILKGDNIKEVVVVDTRKDEFMIAHPPQDLDDVRERFTRVRVIADVHGNMEGFEKAVDVTDDTFLLFLGDLVDYDHRGVDVVRLVLPMVREGRALALRGNHERKIFNWASQGDKFRGHLSHGNEDTVNRVKAMPRQEAQMWKEQFIALVDMSPDWFRLGNWLFTHGAALPDMWESKVFRAPRNSKLESFALFGQTTGRETPEGFPERSVEWVDDIPARHHVMVGHAILSVDEPVVMKSKLGGSATFLDTGSSKDLKGAPGHLSWADFTVNEATMTLDEFGRE